MRYLAFFLLIFWALPAQAHRINIFATYQEGCVRGEVFFNDGKPVRNAKVEIVTPEGIFRTQTNEEGQFVVEIPRDVKEIKIIAYAGMGHRAETIIRPVSETESEKSVPPKTGSVPWRDVFSGLGCIVGIFGLLAYFKGRAARGKS
ncbi:MAG: DUF4198 domain-containing protein [Thermodesulfobacteria bacterium]|nr:DUF4198 domain-containing protein [Thermodesulfobacteriota bacterium]